MCCGLWLERDHGRPRKELMQDPAFVERYVVDLALGLKAAIMLLNPARIVDRRRYLQGRRSSVRAASARSCAGRLPPGRAHGWTWSPGRSFGR